MKKIYLIIVIMAVTFSVIIADTGNEKKIFSSYILVQKSLAADDFVGAKAGLKQLLFYSEGELKADSEKAFKSKNIQNMRRNFKKISLYLVHLKQAEGYSKAYCPIAKSWWIQENGNISNPYFGSKMLRCGTFKEYKEVKSASIGLTPKVKVYTVYGMDCPGCHSGLEKLVKRIPGVAKAEANWKKQQLTIYLKPGKTLDNKKVFKAIKKANFTPGKKKTGSL